MGGLPFLMLLGVYTGVLIWYALNHERDKDGADGILAVIDDDAPAFGVEPESPAAEVEARAVTTKRRGEFGGNPAARIRARAAAAAPPPVDGEG